MKIDMPKPRPPHLHRQETRHGRLVWYVRRGHGPRIRINEEYGTGAFWTKYQEALKGAQPPDVVKEIHTLAGTIDRYRNSSAWAGLSNATRRQRENILRAVIKMAGSVLLRDITADTIRAGKQLLKNDAWSFRVGD
jgi:hypothetical protein